MKANTMKAYHGDPATKEKYIARIRAHRAAETLIRGSYWDGARGCAVGCTLETAKDVHAAFETELGIPAALARLEDRIFESLPSEEAWKAWPEQFLSSIPVGANLAMVWPRFAVWLLSDETYGTRQFCRPDGRAATDAVVALYGRRIAGDEPSSAEWRTARGVADAAAYAARIRAHRVAARAADAATHAAYAAAADVAYAAAYAAADAAAAADADAAAAAAADAAAYAADARAEARGRFWLAARDELLRLLREPA